MGLPTCLVGDGRGYAPLSKRSRPLSPSKYSMRAGPEGDRGPKVTGTWGRAGGLQGRGGRAAAARQAPAASSSQGPWGKQRPGEPSRPP